MSQKAIKKARKLFDMTEGEFIKKGQYRNNGLLLNDYNRLFRGIKKSIRAGNIMPKELDKEIERVRKERNI